MDNPFSSEGQSPFQTPYQAPATAAASGSGIKPFHADDLAPSATSGKSPSALPGPAASPFLESAISHAFGGRELPTGGTSQSNSGKNAYAISPVTNGQPEDFTPAPMMPAPVHGVAASASRIIPLSAMDQVFKPAFFQTSTPSVEGYAIREYLGLVSAEVVVPKDLLFRNPAPHGELHRLKSAEDQLQKVKETALEELSNRARALDADGLVGITLTFSQFDTIVCLCAAVGTAVKLAD